MMLKMRLAPFPLTTVFVVSLPVMVNEVVMAISPVESTIGMPFVAASNTITSPVAAAATAFRKEPGPLSPELVTVIVTALLVSAHRAKASARGHCGPEEFRLMGNGVWG